MNEQKGQQEYLVETEDGFLIRVPADKFESWNKEQEERGSAPLNKAEQRLKDKLLREIYGPKK